MNSQHRCFTLKDVSEIIVGSVLLAFPVAITEEVWNLGATLSVSSTFLLIIISLLFIAWFSYHSIYQSSLGNNQQDLLLRVVVAYVITLTVSALILALFGQFPLLTEPIVAIKRMIIVALPASFCATVIDSLR